MYSEVTRSIKVTVRPFYLEQHSSPNEGHYVWAYHVRIENGGSETVQLRRRHWRITDSSGRLQEVRGPGREILAHLHERHQLPVVGKRRVEPAERVRDAPPFFHWRTRRIAPVDHIPHERADHTDALAAHRR